MNTLRSTKRATAQPTSRDRRSRRLSTALVPLALLAGLLLPATSTATAAEATTATATTTAAAATDNAGNVIPPVLNSHVDQWCDTSSGTSGARVEMLLITEPGDLDTAAAQTFAAELREEARYIDDTFAVASAQTGGAGLGKRIRWATDPGTCQIKVTPVQVDAGTLGQNASTAMAAVQKSYPLQTNRLYLGFTAKTAAQPNMPSCGQTMTMTSPLKNDGSTIQFARVNHMNPANGRTCHSVDPDTYDSTTLHELLHIMGAQYAGSPGSDGGSHCNDGYDALCAAQNDLNPTCEGMWVIDCGKDGYFNTRPAAGSYLADTTNNWNVANSPFLANVAQLPTPPSATVTINNTSPSGNDIVTATVQTVPGANVTWAADLCDYTGAPKSVTADTNGRATYTIQCYGQARPTISARVWRTGEKTVTRPKVAVQYQDGPWPAVTITGPASAQPNQSATLTADLDAPGTWTYQWSAGQTGCNLPVYPATTARSASKTIAVQCDGAASTDYPVFYVDAIRTQDGFESNSAPFTLPITTTDTPTGNLPVVVTGPPAAVGGNTFNVAATVAEAATYSWSVNAGCAATPVPADRSIASVTCPSATNAQVTVAVSATSLDGARSGTGSTKVNVTPAPTPPPPPPVPPTPPVSPKATAVDLSVRASGTNNTFAVTLKSKTGAALAGQRVALQTRPRAGGAYETVAWVTTAADGTAASALPATTAGFARVQFPGDASWTTSVSREVSVSAATVVKAAKWGSKGLKATVKTTGGAAAAKAVVQLQKKVGSKWKKVSSATTNTSGVASVKVRVRAKTVFRFVSSASSAYRSDASPTVTLKP